MLNQKTVFDTLRENGVTFYTGVPDSYLNGFCSFALENYDNCNVIAANEGNAIAIAAGHYFATKEVPLVYMQNSGMGNAINPLASLVDRNVYAVPMVLLIGWRGQGDTEPNHPQHKLQGEITTSLLDILKIPYSVLKDDVDDFSEVVRKAIEYCISERAPYALIAPKGVMAGSDKKNIVDAVYPMSRERAIDIILNNMPQNTIYAATTGRATRELLFLREKREENKNHDFLNVGAMGHASSVALGIALSKPNIPVVTLDGDSAAIMHMGAMTMVSKLHVPNYMHIILNNGAHESVGGQPSAGQMIDFTTVAKGCGYATFGKAVETEEELSIAIQKLKNEDRPSFIDCRIHKGLSHKLPPIVFDHRKAINSLMESLDN